jgi:hypothetical protein
MGNRITFTTECEREEVDLVAKRMGLLRQRGIGANEMGDFGRVIDMVVAGDAFVTETKPEQIAADAYQDGYKEGWADALESPELDSRLLQSYDQGVKEGRRQVVNEFDQMTLWERIKWVLQITSPADIIKMEEPDNEQA